MFRNLSLFGIPMAARWNRRALVVVTYFAALLLTATSVNRGWLLVSWGVATFWIVVPQVVFGWIVTPYFGMAPLIGPRPPERVLHGLMGRDVPAEEPDPDERDLAVRNSAFFRAYWVLAIYCVFVLCIGEVFIQQGGNLRRIFLVVALQMLLVLLVSLPQAVVLWMQPDIPAEA